MFFDIGPLELVALVILAVLIFGPDKLPKVISDVMGFVRKVRAFSDNAKEDIRSELGPEFKDFEFEDLKPRNFVRKHVLENDQYGLQEIRNGFDLKKEMAEVTDAVHGTDSASSADRGSASRVSFDKGGPDTGSGGGSAAPDLFKKGAKSSPGERPPFDPDAT
ncbi:Sec-independent protein translocase subunit TatB [Streptomyces albofaciens JCM 4342]|uniref:sec-independent translocase n=1 Tax=Streptomyces albofaciens TaxID=66866 RepID=UPI00123B9972|nr:sec-independent translocase [Streptomyces albofaciens]KAA6214167.1 Sec-independent protein translocase subunit TatB [Streptomyces albofaciens JCM 4342]